MKKYFIMICLAGAIALPPICPAHAKYHHGNGLVAAAIGGAVAGLVGAVVNSTWNSNQTVIIEQPTYTYVRPMPYVIHTPIVVREPYYHHHHHVRHVRHHHR